MQGAEVPLTDATFPAAQRSPARGQAATGKPDSQWLRLSLIYTLFQVNSARQTYWGVLHQLRSPFNDILGAGESQVTTYVGARLGCVRQWPCGVPKSSTLSGTLSAHHFTGHNKSRLAPVMVLLVRS